MSALRNVSALSSTARTQSIFSSPKRHKLRLKILPIRAQSKEEWPIWIDTASTANPTTQSGADARAKFYPMQKLGWANPSKSGAKIRGELAESSRRHFAAAASVILLSVSGGAQESIGITDAQVQMKLVAEFQEKQAEMETCRNGQ
mmetsp:Transcript_26059/g.43656  ORF Transcript_26059/g.43656 Transcript_26059/m.43656 type:complete len:146 (-) Transcript_26059:248-685(-)